MERSKQLGVDVVLALVLAITACVLVCGCLSDLHANEAYTTATVTSKYIDNSGTTSHYIINTDHGPFEVNRPALDTFDALRNPDVLYGEIRVNQTYVFLTYGYRVDWNYDYPIIVGFVPADNSTRVVG